MIERYALYCRAFTSVLFNGLPQLLYQASNKNFRPLFISLAFFISLSLVAQGQQSDAKFIHLNINQGLSHSYVQSIVKDKYGFMWFGTQNGLNRYDGYRFTVYRNKPGDSTSIPFNDIRCLYEDSEGNLWIGGHLHGIVLYDRKKDVFTTIRDTNTGIAANSNATANAIYEDSRKNLWLCTFSGLVSFDRKTKKYKRYTNNPKDPYSINDDFVLSICEDKRGNLWVGTRDGGLNMFDTKTEKFTHFKHDDKDSASISANNVTAICEDKLGNLWVGTERGGLNEFNIANKKFTTYKESSGGLCNNTIFALSTDADGSVWIGTEGGLNKLNPATKEFNIFKNDPANENTLSHNSIKSIATDKRGMVWVGTFLGGVNLLDKNLFSFQHYKKEVYRPNSLSNNAVTSFLEDGNGNIWIGTDGGGVNVWKKGTNDFKSYVATEVNAGRSVNDNAVLALLKDSDGNIWIGTYGGGINIYHPKTGTFSYITKGDGPKSLGNNQVFALLEDRAGNIWIGNNNAGLHVLDKKTGIITRYLHQPSELNNRKNPTNNDIRALFEDAAGNIWIGTYGGGINIFNPATKTFTYYNRTNSNISSDIIHHISADRQQNIWVGTLGGGLNKFDPKTKNFTTYREEGLTGEVVNGISEDAKGFLWLSTNSGVSRFDPKTKTFKRYDISNGLQGNEFIRSANLRLSTGDILLGGTNGFNVFNPDVVNENKNIPPVVFTNFQLFNKPVVVGAEGSPLQQQIWDTKELTLSHKQSVFTIEFAALNYTMPEKNQYAYMLEGFDTGWNRVGTERKATYTNLDPGEYTFRVKASNNDGVWNEEGASLKIIITPPYWQTWWFRTLVIAAVIGGVVAFFRIRINNVKKQKAALEKQVKERTTEVVEQSKKIQATVEELSLQKEAAERLRQEAEDANRAKSIFLATMSHEIRTPMNGVIGTAALLAETSQTDEQRKYTEIIQTSGESLLTVINDILDFSKIEAGKIELESHSFDLRNCIEEVLDIFGSKAAKAGIDLIYQIESDVPAAIVGDSVRLKQIIINLIGNAIKFTKHGEVLLSVKKLATTSEGMQLYFAIKDTGIGIPKEKQQRLFQAFTQVDSSTTREYGGTGLGLAISKRLVELMGGDIRVESEPGNGTTFSFTINTKAGKAVASGFSSYDFAGLEGKHILIVDDNETNCFILKKQLELWEFTASIAMDAREAISLLKSDKVFDLVITDMQMPGMDGIGLTKEIKKQKSELPVILLSSIGDERNKENLELFAYVLTKPLKQLELCKGIIASLKKEKSSEEKGSEKGKLSTMFASEFPMQILIAEDNPVNQMVVGMIMKKLGYEVNIAPNGAHAVEQVKSKHYHLVLMDVQMPEMDGLEATRVIRTESDYQPVIIAVTANAMHEDREICLQAGMDDYISKPIQMDKLIELLRKWAEEVKRRDEVKAV